MPTCLEKAQIADEETYSFKNLPKVPADERPTQATILEARQAIWKSLMCISNTIPNTGHYGYIFIIYTPDQWTALGNAAQVVPPTNIGAYAGADQTAQYAYEASKAQFSAYK